MLPLLGGASVTGTGRRGAAASRQGHTDDGAEYPAGRGVRPLPD